MSEQNEEKPKTTEEPEEIFTFLEGETIAFAPTNTEHVETYARWTNSEKVRMFARNEVPRSVAEIKKWFEPKQNGPKEHISFEIWHKADHKLIGLGGLNHIDYFSSNANIFMQIGEVDYWNQGIATEAAKLIIKYGFEELNMHKIFAGIFSINHGSNKAAVKAGFIHEATLKQQAYVKGQFVDVNKYYILKDEWMKGKNKE